MRVVVAPDAFGGTLSAREAAAAIAAGWRRVRPLDDLVMVPMSDGGEGFLDAVAGPAHERVTEEVCGPLGYPVDAAMLVAPDGTVVIESALACGLALADRRGRRDPMAATTWGVGQLVAAAIARGARRIVIGLGGTATMDGGSGALGGLGMRLSVADGSGLRVGAADLGRVAAIDRAWARVPDGLDVELLADVATVLAAAPAAFGPQKGARVEDVPLLVGALETWATVVARDLPGGPAPTAAGTGAAGGLGFGLAAALGGRIVAGAARVADLVGLDRGLAGADVVITGEGRLDATTADGKVVAHVAAVAGAAGGIAVAIVGDEVDRTVAAALGVVDVEVAAPGGPGPDPFAEVGEAAARLAARIGAVTTAA